ncbi:hypothetical protein LSAT2_008530 [Lamellibrachia satsuma]|nr:hypothetical protein LSAT2_008530 [Lamellibrachia satsuma]
MGIAGGASTLPSRIDDGKKECRGRVVFEVVAADRSLKHNSTPVLKTSISFADSQGPRSVRQRRSDVSLVMKYYTTGGTTRMPRGVVDDSESSSGNGGFRSYQ